MGRSLEGMASALTDYQLLLDLPYIYRGMVLLHLKNTSCIVIMFVHSFRSIADLDIWKEYPLTACR